MNPAKLTAMGTRVKTNLCLNASDNVAIPMANAKAQAHGGTDSNCVRILP